MADNYLITGYWGEPHVTTENDRGINAAMFGAGRFVLPVGEQFKAEYVGNNTIRMYNGKLMDNGAAAGIPVGKYVDFLIANAGQGMKRNDLVVFQYSQDSSTLIESGTFVVIQGTETSGTASDPALTQEDLLSGEAAFDQMALWRISVSGTTISAPVQLFSVHRNTVDHAADKNNPHHVTAEQLTGVLPIEHGGTGSATAMGAMENITGLYEDSDYPGCYYRIVDGVKEWLNPPMIAGTEYRTTERHLGKVVYVKNFDCGICGQGRTQIVINLPSNYKIVRYFSEGSPFFYGDQKPGYNLYDFWVAVFNYAINIHRNDDGESQYYCTIFYTKD